MQQEQNQNKEENACLCLKFRIKMVVLLVSLKMYVMLSTTEASSFKCVDRRTHTHTSDDKGFKLRLVVRSCIFGVVHYHRHANDGDVGQ